MNEPGFLQEDAFPGNDPPEKKPSPTDEAKSARFRTRLTIVLAVLILVPSMYGFVGKFYEFVRIYRGDWEGSFAIAPMLNYLLASGGFLCLFFWATANRMFHDIEEPKHAMLDNEQRLDQQLGGKP